MHGKLHLALFIALFIIAAPAPGTEWKCGTDKWDNPNCWIQGVPGPDDNAYIDNWGTPIIHATCSATADNVYVGKNAGGYVDHKDGSAVFDTLYLGHEIGAKGWYTLNDSGLLKIDALYSGKDGRGTFTQNNGQVSGRKSTHFEYLKIAYGSDSQGTYIMNDGILKAQAARIGYSAGAKGAFIQYGGTVEITNYLRMGSGYSGSSGPGHGTYTLHDGTLNVGRIETAPGIGDFYHEDGSVTVTDYLSLANSKGNTYPPSGTYSLDKGSLKANIEYIGKIDTGTGTFNHNMGGINNVDYLYIGHDAGSQGTYNIPKLSHARIHAGEFHVGFNGHGFLNVGDPECEITITGKLCFGADSQLYMAPSTSGCPVVMDGASFEIKGIDEAALADLDQVNLVFEGGASVISDFEVAGEDKGPAHSGFPVNFNLKTLTLGGTKEGCVRLVDACDNGNRMKAGGDAEALYVDNLVLKAGSILDLNGLHLYCKNFVGGGTVINGSVVCMNDVPLSVNVSELKEDAVGVVDFYLNAGPQNAFRYYILLGTMSGTVPGIPLPGGLVVLPLNWDAFTSLVLAMINTPLFSNFMGQLDASGKASAQFNTLDKLPAGSASWPLFHYAYALDNPWDFVSNPVAIDIGQ